ncbi:hypothetical protein BDW74DRAFT_80223 [Aspergillus multicolor]|uniref:uncharacterized protein n=1 Tax=Aspergillus multicolor TaxID=41759 RepID=UPI003CCE1592
MAHPASLALGIAPLVALAIKTYDSLYNKTQIYRQYAGIVGRLFKNLATQRQLFLNECHFLLRLVLDDKRIIQAMVADGDHAKWDDMYLVQEWAYRLGSSYRACTGIVEEINDSLNGLEKEIRNFYSISLERQQGEDNRATFKRVRLAVKMALGSTQYDQAISSLRTANGDLRLLRQHLQEFQTGKPPSRRQLKRCEAHLERKPEDHETIRKASQALHETLSSAWCCSQVNHLNHSAKLFVDSTVERDVSLNLLILSESLPTQEKTSDTLHLFIRSFSQTNIDTTSKPRANLGAGHPTSLFPERATKARKFRSTDDCSTRFARSSEDSHDEFNSVNLRRSPDICSELARGITPRQTNRHNMNCLGYLDNADHNYRHLFFPRNPGIPY